MSLSRAGGNRTGVFVSQLELAGPVSVTASFSEPHSPAGAR